MGGHLREDDTQSHESFHHYLWHSKDYPWLTGHWTGHTKLIYSHLLVRKPNPQFQYTNFCSKCPVRLDFFRNFPQGTICRSYHRQWPSPNQFNRVLWFILMILHRRKSSLPTSMLSRRHVKFKVECEPLCNFVLPWNSPRIKLFHKLTIIIMKNIYELAESTTYWVQAECFVLYIQPSKYLNH